MSGIFIGGTGRCGTGLLAQLLGGHPEVYTFPFETKFIIRAGGALDLVSALWKDYDPFLAEIRLASFMSQLKGFVDCVPTQEECRRRIQTWRDRRVLGVAKNGVMAVAPDQDAAVDIGSLIDGMFSSVAHHNSKRVWLDHTPFTALHTQRILALFPNITIVHLVRHPIGVAESLRRQDWSPNNLADACKWLQCYWRRMMPIRTAFKSFTSFREVKLEHLTDSYDETIKRLVLWLGLEPHEFKGEWKDWRDQPFKPEITYKWQKALTGQEISLCNDRLRDIIKELDYA